MNGECGSFEQSFQALSDTVDAGVHDHELILQAELRSYCGASFGAKVEVLGVGSVGYEGQLITL